MAEKEKELTLTQKITGVLKESAGINSEGYIGSEWTEAADLLSKLDPPVVLGIPWCVWDYVLDEFGEPVLEVAYSSWGRSKRFEVGVTELPLDKLREYAIAKGIDVLDSDSRMDILDKIAETWKPKPKRTDRKDVLAILAYIPMRREDPEITLEEVNAMLNKETIRDIVAMVFLFWGVDLAPIEENLAKLADALEEGTENEDAEKAEEVEVVENTANFIE